MKSLILKIVFGGILPIITIFLFFTRYNYIPVTTALGTCEKDFTSLTSYQSRASELASHEIKIMGWPMIICYGQPKVNGRKIFGELVPYGELWRMGANEPTRFYTSADVEMGGLIIPKGRYSLYAIPDRGEWEIFVSRSISHWGNDISPDVRDQEIGNFKVRRRFSPKKTEALTFSSTVPELEDKEVTIYMDWENTRIEIPLKILETQNKTYKGLQEKLQQFTGDEDDLEKVPDN